MRRPWIAFALSFLLPGAGLAYAGKWTWGLLNLVVAVAILGLGLLLLPGIFLDYIHYALLALGAGSAGLAHAVAARSKSPSAQGGNRRRK